MCILSHFILCDAKQFGLLFLVKCLHFSGPISYNCCYHVGAAAVSLEEVWCRCVSRRRSPPPQGGEHASSAVSLVFPPHALLPSASCIVSRWFCAASGCPGKDTEELSDVRQSWCILAHLSGWFGGGDAH